MARAGAAPSSPPGRRPAEGPVPVAWSAAVGIAAGAAYLALAPAVPGDGDAGEFTLVLALNGAAHPTGYPLYTLLGHGFVRALHALGARWAFAANAWSALGGGVAMALMHAFAARWIAPGTPLSRRARGLAALLPVALFALDPAWTGVATMAEVHSWHVAWVMSAALAFVWLARELRAAEWSRAQSLARAGAWGVVCGLGGAHHTSAVLVAAPLSIALLLALARSRRLGPGTLAAALAGVCLPLASYALLYFKALEPGPAVWGNLEPTWRSILEHVTGAEYRVFLGRFNPAPSQQRMLGLDVYPLLFPGLAVLLAAALRSRGTTERWIAAALGAAAALQTLAAFGYGVPDPTSYFLPPLALGLCALAPLGAGLLARGRRRRRRAAVAGALLIVAVLALLGWWVARARQRRDLFDFLEYRVRQTWDGIPFERGFVLWPDDMYHRLDVYQVLGGERPGLVVVNPVALSGPVLRRRFQQQFGFDPFEGLEVAPELVHDPTSRGAAFDEFVSDLGRSLHAGSGLPVALFDWRRGTPVLLAPPARP